MKFRVHFFFGLLIWSLAETQWFIWGDNLRACVYLHLFLDRTSVNPIDFCSTWFTDSLDLCCHMWSATRCYFCSLWFAASAFRPGALQLERLTLEKVLTNMLYHSSSTKLKLKQTCTCVSMKFLSWFAESLWEFW